MASRALMQLNRQGDGRYYNTLVKVVSAQQQVVAGINYRLKLLLGETNCAKSVILFNYFLQGLFFYLQSYDHN